MYKNFKGAFYGLLLVSTICFANDYEFSMDDLESIQTKSYEFSGYLKGDYKYQILNEASPSFPSKDKHSQDTYLGELFLSYKYFIDQYTFNIDMMANYENIDHIKDDTYTLNQGYVNYKIDSNQQLNIGKKSAKWGKGYYFNPVGFIDMKKDPNDPEASREGFTQVNYKYNKVLNNELQNIAFDLVYLRTTNDHNSNLYNDNSNILVFKTYMLYKDIDIDFLYSYSDEDTNKFGLDFSTNLETNFEIHGEYAKYDNGYFSYLLGLKYLTENDLTILSEYLFQNEITNRNEPFWDKKYFINSFTQKEPFDILYLNIYYKNTLNLSDHSHQNKIGFVYSGIENLDIDLSLSKNFGNDTSEFGTKLIKTTSWLSLKYSF